MPYLLVLKFSIDYFTLNWLGYNQAFFSYLDLSYYLNLASANTYNLTLIVCLVFMNLYWIVQVFVFMLGKTYSNTLSNVRKFIFIFTKNILLLPLLNVVIEYISLNLVRAIAAELAS